MKIQIEVNGKKIDAFVNDNEMRAALGSEKQSSGYERVPDGEKFFYVVTQGTVCSDDHEDTGDFCNKLYNCGNYYSDERIAQENERADGLMRRLRRFAAECNSLVPPCSQHGIIDHWSIGYYFSEDTDNYEIQAIGSSEKQNVGEICFSNSSDAEAAIDIFHSELLWYFTEYLPTMR